jgi:hypothetical protein
MASKIEDLVKGKGEQDSLNVEGLDVPVAALKNLMRQGYENLRAYRDSQTISLWGKTASACFTLDQMREKAKRG